jgi:hypothetical protein
MKADNVEKYLTRSGLVQLQPAVATAKAPATGEIPLATY